MRDESDESEPPSRTVQRVLELLTGLDPYELEPGPVDGPSINEYQPEAHDIAQVLHREGSIGPTQLDSIWLHWFSERLTDRTAPRRLDTFIVELNALFDDSAARCEPIRSTGVRSAYARRAAEYAELLGSMDAVHPSDRQLVDTWAADVSGPVIDAGCGPGHWTEHLAQLSLDVRGIDLVPEFIEHARATYPATRFDVGSIDALPDPTGSVGGILAWYSLIHHEPSEITTPLAEFARVLRPGGDLLLGFFEGPTIESFEHAVVTAYRWPIGELGGLLRHAGFDLIETHTRTGPGHRPHGAILARRADDNRKE